MAQEFGRPLLTLSTTNKIRIRIRRIWSATLKCSLARIAKHNVIQHSRSRAFKEKASVLPISSTGAQVDLILSNIVSISIPNIQLVLIRSNIRQLKHEMFLRHGRQPELISKLKVLGTSQTSCDGCQNWLFAVRIKTAKT